MLATPYRVVDVNRDESSWWADMTTAGNEGMVVDSLDFIRKGRRGIARPAIKCRGPEYLRIIYGPEYLLPENLERQVGNLLWGSRRWSDSFERSRCGVRMNAFLVYWRLRANP